MLTSGLTGHIQTGDIPAPKRSIDLSKAPYELSGLGVDYLLCLLLFCAIAPMHEAHHQNPTGQGTTHFPLPPYASPQARSDARYAVPVRTYCSADRKQHRFRSVEALGKVAKCPSHSLARRCMTQTDHFTSFLSYIFDSNRLRTV